MTDEIALAFKERFDDQKYRLRIHHIPGHMAGEYEIIIVDRSNELAFRQRRKFMHQLPDVDGLMNEVAELIKQLSDY